MCGAVSTLPHTSSWRYVKHRDVTLPYLTIFFSLASPYRLKHMTARRRHKFFLELLFWLSVLVIVRKKKLCWWTKLSSKKMESSIGALSLSLWGWYWGKFKISIKMKMIPWRQCRCYFLFMFMFMFMLWSSDSCKCWGHVATLAAVRLWEKKGHSNSTAAVGYPIKVKLSLCSP
jgi:hypothetical protein